MSVIVGHGMTLIGDLFEQYDLLIFKLSNLLFIGRYKAPVIGFDDPVDQPPDLPFHVGQLALRGEKPSLAVMSAFLPCLLEDGRNRFFCVFRRCYVLKERFKCAFHKLFFDRLAIEVTAFLMTVIVPVMTASPFGEPRSHWHVTG